MPQYVATARINHNNTVYDIGDVIADLDEQATQDLLDAQVIQELETKGSKSKPAKTNTEDTTPPENTDNGAENTNPTTSDAIDEQAAPADNSAQDNTSTTDNSGAEVETGNDPLVPASDPASASDSVPSTDSSTTDPSNTNTTSNNDQVTPPAAPATPDAPVAGQPTPDEVAKTAAQVS